MKKFYAVLVLIWTMAAFSQATVTEVIEQCNRAVKSFLIDGKGQSIDRIHSGNFTWEDSYVFAFDTTSVTIAHPIKKQLLGRNLIALNLPDLNNHIFMVDFVKVATTGKEEGWVCYTWPKPGKKRHSPKISFIKRVPGTDILVCAGVYDMGSKELKEELNRIGRGKDIIIKNGF